MGIAEVIFSRTQPVETDLCLLLNTSNFTKHKFKIYFSSVFKVNETNVNIPNFYPPPPVYFLDIYRKAIVLCFIHHNKRFQFYQIFHFDDLQ